MRTNGTARCGPGRTLCALGVRLLWRTRTGGWDAIVVGEYDRAFYSAPPYGYRLGDAGAAPEQGARVVGTVPSARPAPQGGSPGPAPGLGSWPPLTRATGTVFAVALGAVPLPQGQQRRIYLSRG